MSQFSSYMQDNMDDNRSFSAQYLTPDNTQSQPRTQSSQSNIIQIVDSSFLSDAPQSVFSEYSTLDNPSVIPSIIQESNDLTPHTPESLLYSPALDTYPGDDRTDLNSRKQTIPRKSQKNMSNQTPQTSEQQSDSTSLSQESSNILLLQHILLEQPVSRNLDNSRLEQESSTPLIDTENQDINELRDLITTSNMILDSVHRNNVSYKNQEVNDKMKDIEYMHERQQDETTEIFKHPHEISQPELEYEHEHENEYSENVDLVITNEVRP
ncbi:hypothetical protein C1645_346466 [Glomus cerebriforme]|uniref:Uncharacterized protein n=1 Tax=Glomus cerebriforme TaxID=658196 RepID=A0A397TIP5_9GLOM|nr:hypothetical protein C1645_346466 [Glomus cerebriforme]